MPLRPTFAGSKVNLPGAWGVGGGAATGSHHVAPALPRDLSAHRPFKPISQMP